MKSNNPILLEQETNNDHPPQTFSLGRFGLIVLGFLLLYFIVAQFLLSQEKPIEQRPGDISDITEDNLIQALGENHDLFARLERMSQNDSVLIHAIPHLHPALSLPTVDLEVLQRIAASCTAGDQAACNYIKRVLLLANLARFPLTDDQFARLLPLHINNWFLPLYPRPENVLYAGLFPYELTEVFSGNNTGLVIFYVDESGNQVSRNIMLQRGYMFSKGELYTTIMESMVLEVFSDLQTSNMVFKSTLSKRLSWEESMTLLFKHLNTLVE